MSDEKTTPTGLALLRKPFPDNQISKLPKPTKKQTEELRADFKKGQRCDLCGGWHQKEVVHLDYVGHAALTDRLLDCDPAWYWEPLAMGDGLPVMDNMGGMWIKLTVCGVTRLGYGHAGEKQGGDAIKEVIGDALRNAAMRFGAALDLWHKGTLHAEDDDGNAASKAKPDAKKASPNGPISGPAEIFKSLPPDWQTWLRDTAPIVENAFEQQGKEVAQQVVEDLIQNNKLEAEHITGLWHLLGSKTRSSLRQPA